MLSTNHFWYRQPLGDPYIGSQRGNKAFGFTDGTIFLSEDNCRAWPHSIAFPDTKNGEGFRFTRQLERDIILPIRGQMQTDLLVMLLEMVYKE